MALQPIYQIVCDQCRRSGPVWSGTRAKASCAQMARRNAQAGGWRRRKRGEVWLDLCPECAAANQVAKGVPNVAPSKSA